MVILVGSSGFMKVVRPTTTLKHVGRMESQGFRLFERLVLKANSEIS